jgi:hypothetical protein
MRPSIFVGLRGMGKTVLLRLPDAIADYLDAMRECGLPTAVPGEFVVQVTVPAA